MGFVQDDYRGLDDYFLGIFQQVHNCGKQGNAHGHFNGDELCRGRAVGWKVESGDVWSSRPYEISRIGVKVQFGKRDQASRFRYQIRRRWVVYFKLYACLQCTSTIFDIGYVINAKG